MRRIGSVPLCAGLLALTVAAYLPVWRNGFVDLDDELYITDNPAVLQGLTWSGFAWAWTNFHGHYWQPLSWMSLQLDAQVAATRPPKGPPVLSATAFHAQSLFWHACSTLLLFGAWQRLTGARWRSCLVAALFAVHPMHVESVAWAAERKDVLSCFFGILTLWAYAGYVRKPGWRPYLGTAAALLLSLLAKPMLLTLPFVLLLLDHWPLRRLWPAAPGAEPGSAPTPFRRLLLEKAPLFAVAAAVALLTLAVRDQTGTMVSLADIPFSARLANAVTGYGWYMAATLWPRSLAALYLHAGRHWSVPAVLAGVGVLLAGTLLAGWQARRRPWLLVGWLWFVGTLAPVVGLVQGGMQAWADRFSYWPHIGLFVAAVWGAAELVQRLRIPLLVSAAAGALVIGCLGAWTWAQVCTWHDTETLWQHALAVTKDNDRAHVCLGRYYLEQQRPDEAVSHLDEAVRIRPDAAEYQYSLGVALLVLGRQEEAGERFREAVRRSPDHTDAWYNLGVVALRQGKPEAAADCFRKVLELLPESADALAELGLALEREGKRDEAVRTCRAALQINPAAADAWHGLGLVYLARGSLDAAIDALDKAVHSNPGLVNAVSDLGRAYGRRGEWQPAAYCQQAAIRLQEQGEESLGKVHGRAPAPDGTPQLVVLRCRLAFALDQIGEREAAAAAYRAALRQDPLWPWKFLGRAFALATDHDVNRRDPCLACELTAQAVKGLLEDARGGGKEADTFAPRGGETGRH